MKRTDRESSEIGLRHGAGRETTWLDLVACCNWPGPTQFGGFTKGANRRSFNRRATPSRARRPRGTVEVSRAIRRPCHTHNNLHLPPAHILLEPDHPIAGACEVALSFGPLTVVQNRRNAQSQHKHDTHERRSGERPRPSGQIGGPVVLHSRCLDLPPRESTTDGSTSDPTCVAAHLALAIRTTRSYTSSRCAIIRCVENRSAHISRPRAAMSARSRG